MADVQPPRKGPAWDCKHISPVPLGRDHHGWMVFWCSRCGGVQRAGKHGAAYKWAYPSMTKWVKPPKL